MDSDIVIEHIQQSGRGNRYAALSYSKYGQETISTYCEFLQEIHNNSRT